MINQYVGPAVGSVMSRHAGGPTVVGADNALTHVQAIRKNHLPRWRAGGLTGAVMQVSNWSTLGILLGEIQNSEGELVFARSRADYEQRPADAFAIFMSVEGYTSFAGDFEALYTFAELGITAFTFSHNVQNPFCTGANEPYKGGFSHLGKATLRHLADLPIMVDLVHTSRESFWDALDIYDGDVFVSHSNADAVCSHPRNLTDDQIKAVAERNGVIGLNTYRGYVNPEPLKSTVSDLIDHAMHMIELVGAEHVGLGLDYWEGPEGILESTMKSVDPDGSHGLAAEIYSQGPVGIENVGSLGKLVAGFAERGLTQEQIDLVTGGSYLAMLERSRK